MESSFFVKSLKRPLVIGFLSFLLGVFSVLMVQRILSHFSFQFFSYKSSQPQELTDQALQFPFPRQEEWDPFLDDFLSQNMLDQSADPFSKLEELRNQMMKRTHPFDSWYQRKFGGGAPGEIKKREDDQFIYYDISIKGLDQQSLNIKVEEGQVEIQGKIEMKDDQGNVMTSNFHRSYPTPTGVDPQKVEMESDQEKMTLKFPKLKS